MNNQNIMLGYPPPFGKLEKLKNVKQSILMNDGNNFYRLLSTPGISFIYPEH